VLATLLTFFIACGAQTATPAAEPAPAATIPVTTSVAETADTPTLLPRITMGFFPQDGTTYNVPTGDAPHETANLVEVKRSAHGTVEYTLHPASDGTKLLVVKTADIGNEAARNMTLAMSEVSTGKGRAADVPRSAFKVGPNWCGSPKGDLEVHVMSTTLAADACTPLFEPR
jgi:hypothetical protein